MAGTIRTVVPPTSTIEAFVRAEHGDPFSVLGPHQVDDGDIAVRVFLPDARTVRVTDMAGKQLAELERAHVAGFFCGKVPGLERTGRYRLKVKYGAGEVDLDDPYRFWSVLGDLDAHLIGEGAHQRLWDALGAHPREIDGVRGTAFSVWAPNAKRVSVVGDFNYWDGRRHPMRLRHGIGVWELFVPGVDTGARYKYEMKDPNGRVLPLKADPLGQAHELRPANASVVTSTAPFSWDDDDWNSRRGAAGAGDAPVSVYEVHAGSWRRREDGGFLSYRELAEQLVPYVDDMGFTHIELMPVNEHPFDGSWGYQPTGLFAPTSRFGSPADFKGFVEACHAKGIGVIVDWVPGHFPADAHALAKFDGTSLYEHADPRQGFHPDWNTLIYNFGRREVQNFLLASALYWVDRFHVDGLRVDAVASMLYLDYSRKEGEWIPNRYGGRENLEAISFLKRMNDTVRHAHPGVLTIAEESTAFPKVSEPTEHGGLGFHYKWNMGWMNDTLSYMARDPAHRRFHHNEMTFGLMYAFSENFMLPLSHDEVVHGKGSLLGKMPGDDWQRFANLRAYYGFMWTHPGKKLLFMGGELAQWAEWTEARSLDWHLLDFPLHAGVQRLVKDLNRLYRSLPALHRMDRSSEGFRWVIVDDAARSLYAFVREGGEGASPVLVVSNMTPVPRNDVVLGVPAGGRWIERLNTDATDYGGSGSGNQGAVYSGPGVGDWPHSVKVTAPPLATVIFGYAPE